MSGTCPNQASHQHLTGSNRCSVCNLPAFESLGIPVASSVEEMAAFLRGDNTVPELRSQLAAAIARAEKAEAEVAETLALLERGIQLMDGEDALRAQLAAAQRENAAFVALFTFIAQSADSGVLSAEFAGKRWLVERMGQPDVAGLGDTLPGAAIDLATKLGLIPAVAP